MTVRKAVLVLGIARSGTSALSGVLECLGIPFGEGLKPPDEWNPKGNFEHDELSQANQSIFRALDSHWSDETPLPEDWMDRDEVRTQRERIQGLLKETYAEFSVFGLKDPRLCLLLPLYIEALAALDIKPHLMVTYRPARNVYKSLVNTPYVRGECTLPKIRLLHKKYYGAVKEHSGDLPKMELNFDDLIDHKSHQLDRIESFLQAIAPPVSGGREQAERFLDPGLRHYKEFLR